MSMSESNPSAAHATDRLPGVPELLLSHRSIRRFEERVVSDEQLEQIVACGQAAATSSNVQAVSVIHVTEAATREAIAELAGGQSYVASAGAFLVYCADLHRSAAACVAAGGQPMPGMTEQFIIATVDVGLAAQNAVIAAESMALGICYIGGIRNDPAQVCELLGLPDQVYPVFGLCLGYPAQDPEVKPRLPLPAVLMKDRYREEPQAELVARYDETLRAYYQSRSGGTKDSNWSAEMRALVGRESRPHMREFLSRQGFTMR